MSIGCAESLDRAVPATAVLRVQSRADRPAGQAARLHRAPARHATGPSLPRPRHMPTDARALAVIVPAHNEAAQIAETIESLLGQTMPPGRIIVAADNCTDDTVSIARRYPVTVMETVDNAARKSGAMNQAWLLHAQDADLVLTMDADTTLLPDSIERMIEGLLQARSRAAVCSRYWAKEGTGLVWRLQRLEYARYDDKREIRGWRVQVSSGAASLYRGPLLREVTTRYQRPGPWDETSLIEDYGLTLDLKTLGYEVRAAPGSHVLTDTPTSFRSLWRQRQRWGRGGVDECRRRGWTPATRYDIGSYCLFGFSILMRLLFVTYVTLLILSPLGLTLSLLGLIPIAVLWVDRVTSAWRLPGRDRVDLLIASTLILEDSYGLFLECCTLVAIVRSLRSTHQSW